MTAAQVRLKELETRVTWLERAVQELRGNRQLTPVQEDETEALSERERLLAELKAEGLIRDPTPQERASAERWRALPEEKRKAHIRHMNWVCFKWVRTRCDALNRTLKDAFSCSCWPFYRSKVRRTSPSQLK